MQAPISTTPLVARSYMTREVHTVPLDLPIDALAEFFVEHQISGAPVVADDDTLVGVVTLRDVVRTLRYPDREPHRHTANDYYLRPLDGAYAQEELDGFRVGGGYQHTVRDIMTPAAYSVDEGLPVQDVADVMIRARLHRLLVTKEGKLSGILSALDLLRLVRSL
ncbi:MAG: CBS domain-containing protein [Bacteroidota bacterium]